MFTADVDFAAVDMAAVLAHEVKNPLSLLRANIDLLELEDNGSLNAKKYAVMKRELDKINSIVMDFLEMSEPCLDVSSLGLSGLLERHVKPFYETYGKNIIFSLTVPEESPFIAGDAKKLGIVINNILKNAVEAIQSEAFRYPPTGRVDISLSCPDDKGMTIISVRDNGSGFSANEAGNISKPHFTTKQGGSGLGICSSKAIISKHGGSIDFTSPGRNRGCVVTIALPALSTLVPPKNKSSA